MIQTGQQIEGSLSVVSCGFGNPDRQASLLQRTKDQKQIHLVSGVSSRNKVDSATICFVSFITSLLLVVGLPVSAVQTWQRTKDNGRLFWQHQLLAFAYRIRTGQQ